MKQLVRNLGDVSFFSESTRNLHKFCALFKIYNVPEHELDALNLEQFVEVTSGDENVRVTS